MNSSTYQRRLRDQDQDTGRRNGPGCVPLANTMVSRFWTSAHPAWACCILKGTLSATDAQQDQTKFRTSLTEHLRAEESRKHPNPNTREETKCRPIRVISICFLWLRLISPSCWLLLPQTRFCGFSGDFFGSTTSPTVGLVFFSFFSSL